MKKNLLVKRIKNIVIFILSIVFTFNIYGCSKNNTKDKSQNTLVESVKVSGTCNVSVDFKVELLGIVQYLADDPNIIKDSKKIYSKNTQKYNEDIFKYFNDYNDEPAVKLYKKIMKEGFAYDCPPRTMLFVDNNLKLLSDPRLPEDIINRSGGEEKIQEFLDLLENFRIKTDFDNFYNIHKEYYSNLVNSVKNRIDKIKCIEELVNYYGYKQNSFNIILQPLSIGGYGGWTELPDGTLDVYDFMVIPNDDQEFSNLIIHEFSHSYINPLTEKNIDVVNKYSYLFKPIEESMARQAYGSWDTCVNEHIVRAVTYRILDKIYSSEVAQEYVNRDMDNKFIYIKDLSKKLEEYENEKDVYPTFKDFYLKELEKFNKQLTD